MKSLLKRDGFSRVTIGTDGQIFIPGEMFCRTNQVMDDFENLFFTDERVYFIVRKVYVHIRRNCKDLYVRITTDESP